MLAAHVAIDHRQQGQNESNAAIAASRTLVEHSGTEKLRSIGIQQAISSIREARVFHLPLTEQWRLLPGTVVAITNGIRTIALVLAQIMHELMDGPIDGPTCATPQIEHGCHLNLDLTKIVIL